MIYPKPALTVYVSVYEVLNLIWERNIFEHLTKAGKRRNAYRRHSPCGYYLYTIHGALTERKTDIHSPQNLKQPCSKLMDFVIHLYSMHIRHICYPRRPSRSAPAHLGRYLTLQVLGQKPTSPNGGNTFFTEIHTEWTPNPFYTTHMSLFVIYCVCKSLFH